MEKLRTILIVVDPTVERDHVIERAKMLLAHSGASVELFINNYFALRKYVQYPVGADSSFYERHEIEFVDFHMSLLESLQAEFEKFDVPVKTDFRQEKDLAHAILDKIGESRPDLVLKSTHSHNRLKHSFITNTDWRLIRNCAAPLMLIKPAEWHLHGSVIAAVDPLHNKTEQSKLDHDLVSTAEYLAGQLKQTPRIFHSYQSFSDRSQFDGSEYAEVAVEIRELHDQKINQLLASHNIGPEDVEIADGEMIENLLDYLDKTSCNILVIGAYSRHGIDRLIVGSSAEQMLENLQCDVLILKPGAGS